MEVAFKPSFLRQFKKLPASLQAEAKEKIENFRSIDTHVALKVHKLRDRMSKFYSFSINYRYRIVFEWEMQNSSAVLLGIGDHILYD